MQSTDCVRQRMRVTVQFVPILHPSSPSLIPSPSSFHVSPHPPTPGNDPLQPYAVCAAVCAAGGGHGVGGQPAMRPAAALPLARPAGHPALHGDRPQRGHGLQPPGRPAARRAESADAAAASSHGRAQRRRRGGVYRGLLAGVRGRHAVVSAATGFRFMRPCPCCCSCSPTVTRSDSRSLSHFWLGAALMLAPLAAWVAIRGGNRLAAAGAGRGRPALGRRLRHDLCLPGLRVRRANAAPQRAGPLRRRRGAAAGGRVPRWAWSRCWPPCRWSIHGFGAVYLAGVAAMAALLAYEHWLVRPDDLSRVNRAFFHVNAVVSIGLLADRHDGLVADDEFESGMRLRPQRLDQIRARSKRASGCRRPTGNCSSRPRSMSMRSAAWPTWPAGAATATRSITTSTPT